MSITRRDFLKYCFVAAGALGLTGASLVKLKTLIAQKETQLSKFIWLNGAACTGCTISLANTINYISIQDLLVKWEDIESIFPTGKSNGPMDLIFIETLSSAAGARAIDAAFGLLTSGEGFGLCLEGAIQTADNGRFCTIWKVHKEHATLAPGSFVWASADRQLIKVPNDTTESIKVVNEIVLTSNRTTGGIIELHTGSLLKAGSNLANGTWVEKQADRNTLIAESYSFNTDNKINAGGGDISLDITLTGRIELAAGTLLFLSSRISSSSLLLGVADRIALGGVYESAPRLKTGVTRTILEDITLAGTVLIAANSKLITGTVLKTDTWVEDSVDRAAIGGSYDNDNKIQSGNVTLDSTRTFNGRVEALAGSTLLAWDVDKANYLYNSNDQDRTFMDDVLNFAISENCAAVFAVGTCASYGGIPAANGSVTGARGLISTGSISGGYTTVNTQGYWDWLLANCKITQTQWAALMSKTVCVPGCPPHPDWIVGTIIHWLNIGGAPVMDEFHRPSSYYGEYQLSYYQRYLCTDCIWRVNDSTQATNDIDGNAQMSKSGRTIGNSPKLYYYKYDSSYEGCIGILGCKGRRTMADCSYRRWNGDGTTYGGVSWCVQTRAGCHGCTEPRFPDGWGKFFTYK